MKIHEYQAKGILKKYGVAVPRGTMATTREEAEAAAKEILGSGATGVVVKAQIHAGGRGKGGGVKIAKSVEEATELAGNFARLFRRLGELHTAALAASASVDLRLHHDSRSAGAQQIPRRRLRVLTCRRHPAARHGDAILLQNFFTLILMNFHNDSKFVC